MNEQAEHQGQNAQSGAAHRVSEPKSRPVYVKSASEATRELQDTSRRRRDAEEKLQQHLIQAKDHVPHHHDRMDAQANEVLKAEDVKAEDLEAEGREAQDRDGGAQPQENDGGQSARENPEGGAV
jgi:hypothetical protein